MLRIACHVVLKWAVLVTCLIAMIKYLTEHLEARKVYLAYSFSGYSPSW